MTILTLLALLLAGILAGGLTTVAGLGGGILLIAGLSLVWTPAMAIGMTAPALFVGNASRAMFLFPDIDWRMVGKFALTGVPTALAASLLAAYAPTAFVQGAIALLLFAFIGSELFGKRRSEVVAGSPWLAAGKGTRKGSEPSGPLWVPLGAGAIAGTVSGLTGGAGFVATPLLDRLGLTPKQLVATSSAGMGLVHLSKGLGFSLSSVLTPALLPAALTLTVGVLVGNALGVRVLAKLSQAAFRRLLLCALALAAVQLAVTAF